MATPRPYIPPRTTTRTTQRTYVPPRGVQATPINNKSLKTPEGLRSAAVQSGLSKQVNRIPERGESPKEIYSGGFISDTFDTLNALQYGVTGVIKGKGFAEGVRSRESFTDEDALGGKGAGMFIAGIALDILTDPLTYAGGLGIVSKIGKVSGITNAGRKAINAAAKTRAGEQLGRLVVYRFGQDPVYKEMAERAIKNSQREVQNVVELAKPLRALDGSVGKEITRARELGQLGAKKTLTEPVKDTIPKLFKADAVQTGAKTAREIVDEFGRDEILTKARDVLSRNVTDDGVNASFKDLQDFVNKAEKGRDTGEDLLNVANRLSDITGKKMAPKIKLSKEQFEVADKAFTKLDELSETFAKLAFKPDSATYKSFMDNIGTYIRRTYRVIEQGSGRTGSFVSDMKPKRIDADLTKMRKDLPDEVREALDEIREAGYPTAKVMVKLSRSIENLKFFKGVDDAGFAVDKMMPGLKKLPDTVNLGALKGKYVPEPIWDDLQEVIRTPSESLLDNTFTRNIVGSFKFAKVILNPATHVRNMVSNLMLNNFEGLSPARLDIYAKAAHQVKTKGKWYQEARQQGLGLDSFAANEITGWLDDAGSILGKVNTATRENLGKIANMYQKEEEWAKMAQYIYQRSSKGLSPEEAWKVAERATFNYAQVTPTIRRLRESIFGYPFITFTYKVTPQVVRTLIHKPTKISNVGKIKQAIENQVYSGVGDVTPEELERSRASEPDWIRNGFYIALPFKDENGRIPYLDLTYILPFGDLVSGNFFEAPINRETGFQEGPVATVVSKLAFPALLNELVRNQDFYGNKIFKDTDSSEKKMTDIFTHLMRMMSPPMIAEMLPGGYRADGTRRPGAYKRTAEFEQGGIEQGGAQTRSLSQELLRNAGIKINPIDIDLQEDYAEFQEEKALRTILEEAGVTGELKIPYIKK